MRYAVETIWFDRRRYLPAVLAVALSSALIALQVGIMIGLVGTISKPVDSAPGADLGLCPRYLLDRHGNADPDGLRQPHQRRPAGPQDRSLCTRHRVWKNPREGNVLCVVMGCNLADDSLGPVTHLTAAQRLLLTETDAVILDATDCRRLGVDHVGQVSEVFGHRVRVVDFIENMGNLADPYVICSLRTARRLLGMGENRTTYVLAMRGPEPGSLAVAATAEHVRFLRLHRPGVLLEIEGLTGSRGPRSASRSASLRRSACWWVRWLPARRSMRPPWPPYASSPSCALGASRWCLRVHVLEQSLLVGLLGTIVGVPMILGLARIASVMGTEAVMPWWLLSGTSLVTLLMAVLSGLLALRSLRQADPVILLR